MKIRCPKCGAANDEDRVVCDRCQWCLSTPYAQGHRGRDPGSIPAGVFQAAGEVPAATPPGPAPRGPSRWVWVAPALLGAALLCTPIAFLGGYTVGWASQKPSGPPQVEWKTRTVVKWRTRTVTQTRTAPPAAPATIPGSVTWTGDTWPIRIPLEMVNPATGQAFPTYAEIDTGAQWVYSTPQAAKTLGLPVLYQGTQANTGGIQATTVYGPLVVATRSGQPIMRVSQDYAQLTDSWYGVTGNQLDLGQEFWGLPNVHLTIRAGHWTITVDPAS